MFSNVFVKAFIISSFAERSVVFMISLDVRSKDVLNILHTDKKFKTMSQMINIAKEEKIIK